jgi:hypothetical protein
LWYTGSETKEIDMTQQAPSIDSLRAMDSRDAVRDAVAQLTVSQLKAMVKQLNGRPASATKAALTNLVVQLTVAGRLKSDVLRGL